MDKIREIIRIKEQANLSERAIARALHISRPVVNNYLAAIERAGLDYAAVKEMDDDTLREILQNKCTAVSERYKELSGKFDYLARELKRTGVTLLRLWQEYRAECPDGYHYSQFCYHFQNWRNASELTMHIDHKAGDKMFVDFTGKHLAIVDRTTGDVKEVEILVALLGASQLTYVEAVASQQKEDWINANQRAFQYFGGVPLAIVPDCLKTAVTKACKYEPDLNPEFYDFARHYHTTILPARPASPRDKALVEGAVKIVYAWIFAALRNRIFGSLEELNSAIREELDRYNAKPMQLLKRSRRELFNDIEKAVLTSLPKEPYVIRRFYKAKALFNYHVRLKEDNHYYSVPYRYRGRQIVIIYNDTVVELFCNNWRLAIHKRDRTPGGYTTIKEHMPSHHRFVSDWNPQRFIRWAQQIGGHVQLVVEYILAERQHPEQAYKVCLGILNLEKNYSRERLNKACQRAIVFQLYSYKAIKNILDNNLEDCQLDYFAPLPEHHNIRGHAYYQ